VNLQIPPPRCQNLFEKSPGCHPERSEGSFRADYVGKKEILRCAQNDKYVVAIFKTRSEALIQECYDVFSVDNLFHAFADAGKKLADLSVNCESAKEFPLTR
jgi:hypothetical protein